MARRKDVFQSKVLQKLFPAAPKLEKDAGSPCVVETSAKKKHMKTTASKLDTANGDDGMTKCAANPGRRLYTALPPPADYITHPEKSVTLLQLENINSAEDPAEESIHEDLDQEEEAEEHRKRKRRRKRRPAFLGDAGKDGAASMSESSGPGGRADCEGGERISRNKKRKLKKKRHKEKLLSMGLMPRASALEFTYQKDGEEKEEEAVDRRAAEVSDFLRTTVEIYTSDSASHVNRLPHLSGTVDELLRSIAGGSRPTSLLKQLHGLQSLVQQRETDRLAEALEDFCNSTTTSAEETAAVVSLFQYWITDILPVQGDSATALLPARPSDCQSHGNRVC